MSYQPKKINYNNKPQFYKELASDLEGYLESHFITNMAQFSSLVFDQLPVVNWVGFYLFNPQNQELVLGPFHGKPACTRIALGRGVCGTSFKNNEALLIKNVHEFKDHIACDSESLSEIVIPLIDPQTNFSLGVLDVDSPQLDRFDQEDLLGLSLLLNLLLQKSDIESYVSSKIFTCR